MRFIRGAFIAALIKHIPLTEQLSLILQLLVHSSFLDVLLSSKTAWLCFDISFSKFGIHEYEILMVYLLSILYITRYCFPGWFLMWYKKVDCNKRHVILIFLCSYCYFAHIQVWYQTRCFLELSRVRFFPF